MRVFISWSGNKSKEIAEFLKTWLKDVNQKVDPYFTPTDIEKGSRWHQEIQSELQRSGVGIFVLTKENIDSIWMHYEAGAISRSESSSKICPLLIGLESSELQGPLSLFQSTKFNKDEAYKLVETINNKLEVEAISDETLRRGFEKWWPELEEKINSVLNLEDVSEHREQRPINEILEEILTFVRQDNRNSNKLASLAVSFVIKTLGPIVFAKYKGENFTERQIAALKSLEIELLLEFGVDADGLKSLSEARSSLERHLADMLKKKKDELDDDIPF